MVLFIGLTEDASPEDASAVVARCSAPTLEDAKQIAQRWELEPDPFGDDHNFHTGVPAVRPPTYVHGGVVVTASSDA